MKENTLSSGHSPTPDDPPLAPSAAAEEAPARGLLCPVFLVGPLKADRGFDGVLQGLQRRGRADVRVERLRCRFIVVDRGKL